MRLPCPLIVLALAAPLAAQNAFTIRMPVRDGDTANTTMGLNSFGAHIGNHGIDGHPGWDVEYRLGASVLAAADGVVQRVAPDDTGRYTVQIMHGQRFRTNYTNLAELDPAMVVGTPVAAGQRIGVPATNTQTVGTATLTWAAIHFQVDDFTVNYGLTNGFAVSPEAHLDPTARALFERIWSNAVYFQEICEPFVSNPRNVEFPLVRTWTRESGALAPRIEFTCATATSSAYRYRLLDAAGSPTETGTLQPVSPGAAYTFDLIPAAGATRRGRLRIVNDTMQLDFGAEPSAYRTAGYPLAVASAASYSAKLATASIAVAFGRGLAVATASAPSVTLPTTLAGSRIFVEDSAGVAREGALYYVTPGQIGWVVPPNTATGTATVRIASPDGPVFTAAVTIDRVAPGLFSADSTGAGPAAALAQRVRADGSQSTEPITGGIDFGPSTDQVYLVLYGTGMRGPATVTIGGLDLQPAFAGAQGGYPGLDQVNVLLPRTLAGRGTTTVAVTVEGVASNSVTVSLR